MADPLIQIAGALGRIEEKMDSHMEAGRIQSAEQVVINRDLYEKYAVQDRFRSRVKGVAKGASIVTGLVAGVVGLWAKAKGLW